jgi:hypothetical protein
VTETGYGPNTYLSLYYFPGDQFVVPAQPDTVHTVTKRAEVGGFIELTLEDGQELAFPNSEALPARRRIRTLTVPCTTCKEPVRKTVDTAYPHQTPTTCDQHGQGD